jgi:pimeloyl-ACP methyl ester carboxylesterase
MKNLAIISNFLFIMTGFSQTKTTIYCFPGQGSDKRIFDSLIITGEYELKVVQYGTPEKNDNMRSFAKRLSAEIDTTKPFILLGVSLGGMICTELTEILHPRKTILISSAKNRNELPFRYKFQKQIPIYKLFPGKVLLAGAKMLQPIVEPDRNRNKKVFKSMLGEKEAVYMKRTVNLIIQWERIAANKKIIHIHGTKDHTLPFKKIRDVNYSVNKGSHMMTVTRAGEISEILNKILLEVN